MRSVALLGLACLVGCASPVATSGLAGLELPTDAIPSVLTEVEQAEAPSATASGTAPSLAGGDAASIALASSMRIADDAPEEGWNYAAMPYLWAASMKGSMTVMGTRSTVDSSFSELFENVDFAMQGSFQASKDEHHILFDATYIDIGISDAEAGPLSLDADADIYIAQLLYGQNLTESGDWRGVVGLRYYKVDIDADLSPGPSLGGDQSWIDPVIGFVAMQPIDDEGLWTFVGQADIGGFGLWEDASRFSWQASALANRKLESGDLILGYRVLDIDYHKGSGSKEFVFDNQLFGPVFGWIFRF